VFVREKDGRYAKGFISSKQHNRFAVKKYGGKLVNVSVHDTPAVVLDKIPSVHEVHIGSAVIGSWKGTDKWYFGRVMKAKEEEGKALFHILFDDGDEIWHTLENIRIVPLKYRDGKLTGTQQINPLKYFRHRKRNVALFMRWKWCGHVCWW
jgi:hypothetical protein